MKATNKIVLAIFATMAAINAAQAFELSTEVASVETKAHDNQQAGNDTALTSKVLRVGVAHTVALGNDINVSGSVKVGTGINNASDANAFQGATYKNDLSARIQAAKAVGGVDIYGGLQAQRFELDGALQNIKQSQESAFVGVSVPKPVSGIPALQAVSFEAGYVLHSSLTDSGDYGNGWESFTTASRGGSTYKVAAAFKAGEYTISPFYAVAAPSSNAVEVKSSQFGVSVSRAF